MRNNFEKKNLDSNDTNMSNSVRNVKKKIGSFFVVAAVPPPFLRRSFFYIIITAAMPNLNAVTFFGRIPTLVL